jgi:hypothetical protein
VTPFDPIAWAAAQGVGPGEPRRLEEPEADMAGTVEVDRRSLAARVPRRMAGVAVEGRLREQGLTLGLFPERYEVASVGAMVEADDPGAGASGSGFGSLVLEQDTATLLLAVRVRPDAQAGRAFRCPDLASGAEALRLAAHAELLCDLALVADAGAAGLLLAVAQDPDGASQRLRGGALVILIAAGRQGEAAGRLEATARVLPDEFEDLGQNAARAWAQSRYDLAMHARTLAAAGYDLGVTYDWHPWSRLDEAAAAAEMAPGYIGCQLAGCSPHGGRLALRTLSGESQNGDAHGHQAGADQPHPGDRLAEEAGGQPGGDDDARLADGGDGAR